MDRAQARIRHAEWSRIVSLDAELADRLRDAVVEVLSDRQLLEAVVDAADRPLVLSPREAGVLLGVSDKQVREMLDAGHLSRLPGVGKRVLIPRASVEAYVARAVSS